ncbi:uncharacterized protein DFL_009290 [Arthrobotrys flagrans]|uniref:Uncharacterized protein n=1 Tax=Arthrobotrys flagrans TaxID=97331 RepID=A0A436ZRP1_ARTFL|nr:hypothetical protein DFL_009290 [Arthrobotrys flagrans]
MARRCLPSLLGVNKSFRKPTLESYHMVITYPRDIASKYEFCPLTLTFPEWFTAPSNDPDHNNSMLIDKLRREIPDLGNHMRMRDWIEWKQLILIALVKKSLDRGVDGDVAKFLDKGFKLQKYGEGKEYEGKGKCGAQERSPVESKINWDQYLFKGFPSDYIMDPEYPHIHPTIVLEQSLAYAIHNTVLEEINYSFPLVKLGKLHPVQMLELLRVRVPPWSWSQEYQVERLKRVSVMGPKSREEIGRYGREWEEMRGCGGVLGAGAL